MTFSLRALWNNKPDDPAMALVKGKKPMHALLNTLKYSLLEQWQRDLARGFYHDGDNYYNTIHIPMETSGYVRDCLNTARGNNATVRLVPDLRARLDRCEFELDIQVCQAMVWHISAEGSRRVFESALKKYRARAEKYLDTHDTPGIEKKDLDAVIYDGLRGPPSAVPGAVRALIDDCEKIRDNMTLAAIALAPKKAAGPAR